MIIKIFVALGFIGGIDNLFAHSFSKDIKENVEMLNKTGLLEMSEDNNTL